MKLTMDLGAQGYQVFIKEGILHKAGQLANFTQKVLLVTHEDVPASYIKTLAAQCGQVFVHKLPGRDKSLQAVEPLLRRMQELQMDGEDSLAALGGTRVMDLCGVAACLYRRNVHLCLVPTTLTAQCDTAVGGWFYLNQNGYKNLSGLCMQPEVVIADPGLLQTLPPRSLHSGLAMILKTGLSLNRDLFEELEQSEGTYHWERLIYLNLLYRKGLLERDPAFTGEAQLACFGHPLGYALESAGHFEQLLWGEALALGMLPLLENRTLARRTLALMKKLGLPCKLPPTLDSPGPYLDASPHRIKDTYSLVRVKTLGQGYQEHLPREELRLLMADYFKIAL